MKNECRQWPWYLACFLLGAVVSFSLNAWWQYRKDHPAEAKTEHVVNADGDTKRGYNPHEGEAVRYPGRSINYGREFASLNDTHQAAAAAVGLSVKPANREAAMQMRSELVEVKDCRNYVLDPLTHSAPYLCPGAKAELDRIGEQWADILSRNGLPHYRFILTSVLRTEEDVTKLRRSNGNASENSAHCYGTTWDITYTRFEKASESDTYVPEDNLMLVLAQVLLNEQRAERIYVKYERKQACFHITSRR